ncbi:MAG: enolase C-terminal domain-like protein [Paludisphaera borealis]|uniref:enolase C-terminal domain-like protein n=1 Tax=Paludisphaera borealis TaxID=1387353 RepID=UPI002846DCA4|nr:enolase C-terminal domain-like protein [Paludisphaera borealis]MDR3619726.1 enolase C-terminal domain-like protein [Paludisphaera borealis]
MATDKSPIDRVVLTHIQIPLKEPCPGDGGEAGGKNAIVVTVETSCGVAHGESSPASVSSGGSVEGCWNDLARSIAPSLLGATVDSTRRIAEIASSWRTSRTAAAGAETALWDLLGQAHRATVAQLLGADDAQAVRGVQSGLVMGLYPSVVELLKAIEPHLDEGYRRLKIRIAPGHDVEFVRAVRQHFEDVPLMVDGGGAYTTADLDLFRELDDLDLLMIEQPFAADDVDGLAVLQKALATPICLDETAETHDQTAEAIRRGACRIVSLKIQRTGGLGPARAIHDLCFQQGVACWVGSTPELGLGQAYGVHLATLANSKYPADLEPSARWFVDDYVAPVFELSSPGLFAVPDRPGVGFQVDPQKLRRYQVRQETFSRSTSA